jgi:glucose-6-phosphate 1-epimerase
MQMQPRSDDLMSCRGGVPVCFPQFGQLGPLGQHGFARNSMFRVTEATDNKVVLVSPSCL